MNEHDTVVPSGRRVLGLLLPGELSSSPGRGAQVWPYCVCGCIVVTGCELPRVVVVVAQEWVPRCRGPVVVCCNCIDPDVVCVLWWGPRSGLPRI